MITLQDLYNIVGNKITNEAGKAKLYVNEANAYRLLFVV